MHADYQHYQHMATATVHERCLPHRVVDDVWMWSVYSDEKMMYFNGYLVQIDEHASLIIDPPCCGPDVLDGFTPLPQPQWLILTNADHERAAFQFQERFGLPIYSPEQDAARLSQPPDHTFQDGHLFPGGWQVIHLPNQKTPGESALYNQEKQILILGDALIGSPWQHVSMLPTNKYADPAKAREGLQRLRSLAVSAILPGDGDPILQNADSLLADALIVHSN